MIETIIIWTRQRERERQRKREGEKKDREREGESAGEIVSYLGIGCRRSEQNLSSKLS